MSEQGDNDYQDMAPITELTTNGGSATPEPKDGMDATDLKSFREATGSPGEGVPKITRLSHEIDDDTTGVTDVSEDPGDQHSSLQPRVQDLLGRRRFDGDAKVIEDAGTVGGTLAPDTPSPAKDAMELLNKVEKEEAASQRPSEQRNKVNFSVTGGSKAFKDSCLSKNEQSRANSQDSLFSRASRYLQSAASDSYDWISGTGTNNKEDESKSWWDRRSGLPGAVNSVQTGTRAWLGELKDEVTSLRPTQQVVLTATCALFYQSFKLGSMALSEASSRRAFEVKS